MKTPREDDFIPYRQPKFLRVRSPFWLHLLLFVLTFLTTTIAGTQWAMKDYLNVINWGYGLTYSILIMLFLSAHEFGHYFASKIHKVDASFPYFIPVPFPDIMLFGTLGAVIATRSPIPNRRALFDIGIAGPLAGFVVSIVFLIYGLATLPPKEFIYTIHPEYLEKYQGMIPNTGLYFGDTIIYSFLAGIFANPNGWLPPMNEIYHYPFLCVGWFGIFVTTLNLLPFGQLDGGHILYAMFGRKQFLISRIVWWLLVILGLGSLLNTLHSIFLNFDYPNQIYIFFQESLLPILEFLKKTIPFWFEAWSGWLFWAIFVRLFIKLPHPYVQYATPLSFNQKILGWFAILIFVLTFSFNGIYFK
ncbi:MAG: site-2 protease family protein [Ignavibacteria bacterium]|nr:site-2 protease family protein [Ignavibacteria bacterium]